LLDSKEQSIDYTLNSQYRKACGEMKLKEIFNKFQLSSVTLSTPIGDAEIQFVTADEDAAWGLYIELITRTTIQPISDENGIELAILESVRSIFPTTRELLKEYGRKGQAFSKIAVIVLNQVLRPFTTKWHKSAQNSLFEDATVAKEFRAELAALQADLRHFTSMLAEIARVDDISELI
jgi:hypothetical protein